VKEDQNPLYQVAFDLKNAEKIPEAIAEFKRLIDENSDPEGLAPIMIAMLYFHELNDHESALPYAKRAVDLKPNNQMASLCLVHCLFHAGQHDEVRSEIRRYVKTGGKLDRYKTLFEENGVKTEDFI
jgi:tetratricopeptide (TPR) repeat protein